MRAWQVSSQGFAPIQCVKSHLKTGHHPTKFHSRTHTVGDCVWLVMISSLQFLKTSRDRVSNTNCMELPITEVPCTVAITQQRSSTLLSSSGIPATTRGKPDRERNWCWIPGCVYLLVKSIESCLCVLEWCYSVDIPRQSVALCDRSFGFILGALSNSECISISL